MYLFMFIYIFWYSCIYVRKYGVPRTQRYLRDASRPLHTLKLLMNSITYIYIYICIHDIKHLTYLYT